MSLTIMVTSLLRRVLCSIALCFGFSAEQPGSMETLAQPSTEASSSCPRKTFAQPSTEATSSCPRKTLAQPSTEASSSCPRKWQVFVSFRGEDTRNNFKSHLEAALKRRCINAYVDNINLRAGDEISPSLKEAIQGSKIALVILSKNYASSAWCLNELLWILECRQNNNQIVIPIFYNVIPADVRYQRESFADAFVKHSTRKRSDDEMESWRNALKKVADLSGHHFSDKKSEHELIEKVAEDISSRLTFGSSNNVKDLVGIQSRIEQVTSLLQLESEEVVKVGIWGMGGIGKTTIARAVFDQISYQFEGCYFIPNVREDFRKHDGHISLENKLVSMILGEKECQEITPVIRDRLQCKKVVIVLDDVSDSMHLEFLRHRNCFGKGSRVIITSRDKQVLQQVVDEIYQVEGLIKGDDLQLFSLFAFNARYPEDDFVELSHRLIECAKGVPLALKVLGSALKGKSCRVWESFLHKLKETQDPTVQKILKISYDDLDDKQKDLFLDIACFFRGKETVYVSELYGASADYDIGVLIDKSLIVLIEDSNLNFVEMHDLLQEMGCDIVCKESVMEPGKRSRLWKQGDVCNVLKNNMGTEAVQAMELDLWKMRELHITSTAFKMMNNLRIFNFYFPLLDLPFSRHVKQRMSVHPPPDQKLYVTGDSLCSLSDKLNHLRWDRCPLKSLPLQFCAENLVQLIMPYSKLEKLWDGDQNLANLKRIILIGSENLLEIPNLSQAKHLKSMDLSDCISLCDLPNCTRLTSLDTLNLKGCSKITKFPEISESIRKLNLSETAIEEVPTSIGGFSRLEDLNLMHCQMLQIIPISICQLDSLKVIYLSTFPNIERHTELLGYVKGLYMGMSGYTILINQIRFEVVPYLENYSEWARIQNCISCMTSLKELECFMGSAGESLHYLQSLRSLESLILTHCFFEEFPRCLTSMLSLKDLNLRGNDFESIPESIKHLSALEKLDLSDCKRLQSLPELPIGLKYLIADGCESLESISTPLSVSSSVRRITFNECDKLDTSPLENEAQRIIMHRAHEDVKLCAKGCINNPPLFISYPGSEVPKWFSDHSMGSSITIKLPPPHFLDNKFLGIAFVAILDRSLEDIDIGVKCMFKSERVVSHQFDVPLVTSYKTFIGWSGFPNVVIGYSCRWYCELLEFGQSHFKFNQASFSFSTGTDKINKCGVCLLYTKDDAEPHHA